MPDEAAHLPDTFMETVASAKAADVEVFVRYFMVRPFADCSEQRSMRTQTGLEHQFEKYS